MAPGTGQVQFVVLLARQHLDELGAALEQLLHAPKIDGARHPAARAQDIIGIHAPAVSDRRNASSSHSPSGWPDRPAVVR